MKLFLYRLSLTEAGPDLFHMDPVPDRQAYLKYRFTKDFQFAYRKDIKLRYQHTQIDGQVIAGIICRWVSRQVEGDPVDPFAVTDSGEWEKSAFFFNIGDDEQVFALEHNPSVGTPHSVIKQVVLEINTLTLCRPYKIDAFALKNEKSFSKAISEYKGPVTSLTFDLVTPNPINGEGLTRAALKKLRLSTNGDSIKATIKSNEGLILNNSIATGIANYAENGGGDIIARDGKYTIYDSSKAVRTIDIPDALRPNGTEIPSLEGEVVTMLVK